MVLDAIAGVLDDATALANRKVLFGLLFISLAEEEGIGIVELVLQPLLAPLIVAAGCSDGGTATCLPGEAGNKK